MPQCGGDIRSVGNFILQHPEYEGVVRDLIKSEEGEWVMIRNLKQDNGIATQRYSEDFGIWISFTQRMKHREYVETKMSSNMVGWMRVAPDKRGELQRLLDWVKA